MKIRVFNVDSLKNINPKSIIRKAVVATLPLALVFSLTGCRLNISRVKTANNTHTPTVEYSTPEVLPSETSTPDIDSSKTAEEEAITPEPTYVEDPSTEYRLMYIGDGKDYNDSSKYIEYKDNDNAFTREKSNIVDTSVAITSENEQELREVLDQYDVDIPYSGLFNLEHLLERQENENTHVQHENSFKLTDGKISSDELYRVITNNNQNYPVRDAGYYTLSGNEIKEICNIIADTLNDEISSNPYIDINSLLCNVRSLKVLGEKNVTNARITYDNVLAISGDMISNLQSQLKSNEIDAYTSTILHETEHLPQMNCDDEVDKETGNRIGFNRKWSDEPINSLFWNWYYEASAETLAATNANTDNIIYENQTNYLKYFKVAFAPSPNFKTDSLEKASVSRDSSDFYSIFGANSKEDKIKIAQMMYAVELIQNENKDFAKVYLNYVNSDKSFVGGDEWISIKRELKCGLALNMSKMFYENLVEGIKAGNMTLNDVYRLITLFEAESEQHLLYDSTTRFDYNASFMEGYTAMQSVFFQTISTEAGYSYDEIVEGFNRYSLKDGKNMNSLSTETNEFISKREAELVKHMTTSVANTYNTYTKELGNQKTL